MEETLETPGRKQDRRQAVLNSVLLRQTFFPHVQFTLQNSSSPSTDQTPWKFSAENFDIRRDPLFWDELKAGFVDEDPLTRKRSLYLLKQALPKLALQLHTVAEQSFLELDWAHAFEICACVSEEFMLGSLLTALDDPTHHRDFGSHIELCWTFSDNRFFSYCSFHYGSSNRATIFVWDHANFIQHLAKAILARSPCQAGLMIIAICLEAAAAVATAAAQFSENKSLEKMPDATTYQHPVGHSTSDARDGNTHWVSSSMDGAGPQQKAEVLLKDLKTGAEVQVGCYEALVVVCAAFAITLSPSVGVSVFATTWVVKDTPLLDYLNVSSVVDGFVDGLASGLLANVESILQKGALARSRHAVLACLSDKKISLLFLLKNQMQIFGSEVFKIFARSFP
ncbi:unnamed protein product [Sphagnum jensenii]|uniref:Uncharacterized protein n=1 Tax=Sphagnum jensenii TaxID=128206 RepID=A0ABP0X8W3_9BRYO